MTKDRHGTCLEYMEVQGTTPIVLVHGVGLDQNIWRAMLGDFSARSTLTYDLLGHGETEKALGEQSFHPFVDQLHMLLEELQISEVVLAGFSLGGQVAKHFTAAHSDVVRGLVLISTTYQRTPKEREAMSHRVGQAISGDQRGLETAALHRWFNPEFLSANPAVEQEISARLRNNDPARFLESYQLLSNAEDHYLDYASLPVPTLVITGDSDSGSTPRMATEMAQAMPNASVEIIQGAKHLGIIERHLEFNDAITGFMAEFGL
jgi:pimeloyl-ACP methyl ester carboxylesterase